MGLLVVKHFIFAAASNEISNDKTLRIGQFGLRQWDIMWLSTPLPNRYFWKFVVLTVISSVGSLFSRKWTLLNLEVWKLLLPRVAIVQYVQRRLCMVPIPHSHTSDTHLHQCGADAVDGASPPPGHEQRHITVSVVSHIRHRSIKMIGMLVTS